MELRNFCKKPGVSGAIIRGMWLKNNLKIKQEMWNSHCQELLRLVSPEIKEAYAFIFAMGDVASLLSLQNEEVQKHLAMIQGTYLESQIKITLDEMMSPIQYRTELEGLDCIVIESQCKLGMNHKIRETSSGTGFELSLERKSEPGQALEIVLVQSMDEIIDAIASLEQTWREKKSIKLPDEDS